MPYDGHLLESLDKCTYVVIHGCYKCGSDLCLINEPVGKRSAMVDLTSSHGQMKTNTSS